jgi:hypothetical protein
MTVLFADIFMTKECLKNDVFMHKSMPLNATNGTLLSYMQDISIFPSIFVMPLVEKLD